MLLFAAAVGNEMIYITTNISLTIAEMRRKQKQTTFLFLSMMKAEHRVIR